jgi:hypothetical protein
MVCLSHVNVAEFAWFERGKLGKVLKKFPTIWEIEFFFIVQILRHKDCFIFCSSGSKEEALN